MFSVYVLRSQSSGNIYIGQSSDPQKRLSRHNDPNFAKGSYTKNAGSNWEIVYQENFETREQAIVREKQLKSFRGREFLKKSLKII